MISRVVACVCLLALAPALAACGGSGGSAASCGLKVVGQPDAAAATIADASLRHYSATFYSRLSNVYELELALGGDARIAGRKVSAPSEVAFRVKNVGQEHAALGSPGCSGPLLVRIFYAVPPAASRDVAAARRTTESGPGGEQLFWVDYRFTNTSGDKSLSVGQSAVLTQTGAPPPIPTSSAAAARALRSALAGVPRDVFLAGGFIRGTYAIDGAATCILHGPGGDLRLIVAWNGGGDPYDLSGDGCLYSAEDVYLTADHWMPTG